MNFKSLRRLVAPTIVCMAIAAIVNASPIGYYNQPGSFYDAVNYLVGQINSTQAPAAPLVACTTTLASANATCNGLRDGITVSSITTATNGVVSNAITVNDSAATAASQIICSVNGYASNGVPADVNIVPSNGTFTFQIQNTSVSGAALNASVLNNCLVLN